MGNSTRDISREGAALPVEPFERLSGREIARSITADVFNLDLPLLRTFVDLTIRPGDACREFVDGHRRKYTNPVKYCVLAAAIYALVLVVFNVDLALKVSLQGSESAQELGAVIQARGNEFLQTQMNWLVLAAVPGFALVMRVVFRKSELNYVENLVLMLYVIAQTTLLSAVLAPFGGETNPTLKIGGMLVGVVYVVWASYRFFRLPLWATLWRSLVAHLLFLVVNALVATVAVGAFVALPAYLEYRG